MRNSLWLALLLVSVSCTSNNTHTSANPEYLRCVTVDGTGITADNGSAGSDKAIFGSSSKISDYSCKTNTGICGTLGTNFYCNMEKGCCEEQKMGRCNKSADCDMNDKPVCDTTNNICIACTAANPQTGDQQCAAWNTARMDPLNRVLCISGACAECRDNNDCKRAGKTFCNQTTNVCGGCTKNSDCPGSNICKLDESLLATGDTLSNLGECVKPTDVVFVDKGDTNCATGDGTQSKPYCQVTTAIAAGKSYISVKGTGGATASQYMTVTVGTSGQRVAILGPGRDVSYMTTQAVINGVTVSNGAQVTLVGLAVSNTVQPAVQCNNSGTLYAQNVLITDTVSASKGGIYADMCSKVVVERTKVNGAGAGYGISINGGSGHRVVNNAIINNGSAGEPAGLKLSGGAAGLFAFNTIAGNRSGGVQCDTAATITDSIVVSNGATQLSANCQQPRGVTDATKVALANYTTGNDPKLLSDPLNDSCCVDKGMPDSGMTIKDDYLSIKRPLGQGYDFGAFELK